MSEEALQRLMGLADELSRRRRWFDFETFAAQEARATLESALREALRDGERLDWLEATAPGKTALGKNPEGVWELFHAGRKKLASSARAALDQMKDTP
jgi:hypothetical protein